MVWYDFILTEEEQKIERLNRNKSWGRYMEDKFEIEMFCSGKPVKRTGKGSDFEDL